MLKKEEKNWISLTPMFERNNKRLQGIKILDGLG
jgi:hypothetical protein